MPDRFKFAAAISSAVSKSIAHPLDLVLIDLISRQIPLLVPEMANGAPEF